MCKITFFFSNFRRPVLLLVGPALGAQIEGAGVWETGSKAPPSPGVAQTAGFAVSSSEANGLDESHRVAV